LYRSSTRHFASDSWVIAPGPHGGYWRKRANRKMRRRKDQRADKEIVARKIKAKISIAM
jgi:hypothetical protein